MDELARAIQIIEDYLLRCEQIEIKFELTYMEDEDEDGEYCEVPIVLYEAHKLGESSRYDQQIASSGYAHEHFRSAVIGLANHLQAWHEKQETLKGVNK